MVKPLPRLRLQGFNNLTKALSFNIYDVCYAVSEDERRRYIEYIDEQYDADRLTHLDAAGKARMVDVAERAITVRTASASAVGWASWDSKWICASIRPGMA